MHFEEACHHAPLAYIGVRVIYPVSGAIGEGRDQRGQVQNKRVAFQRLAESEKFRAWLKIEAARAMLSQGESWAIKERVEAWMSPENLVVEFFTP